MRTQLFGHDAEHEVAHVDRRAFVQNGGRRDLAAIDGSTRITLPSLNTNRACRFEIEPSGRTMSLLLTRPTDTSGVDGAYARSSPPRWVIRIFSRRGKMLSSVEGILVHRT